MERGSFHYKEKMVEGYNILTTKNIQYSGSTTYFSQVNSGFYHEFK